MPSATPCPRWAGRELPRDPGRGLATIERAAALARERGLVELVGNSYLARATTAVWTQPDDLARIAFEEGLAYARKQGDELHELYLLANRARFELDQGRWADAVESAELVLGRRWVSTLPRTLALTVIARTRARRGDPNVLPLLAEARALAEPTGELLRIAPVAVAAAEAAWLIRRYRGRPRSDRRGAGPRGACRGPARHRQPPGVAQTRRHRGAAAPARGRGTQQARARRRVRGGRGCLEGTWTALRGRARARGRRDRARSPALARATHQSRRSGNGGPWSPAACARSERERSRAARGRRRAATQLSSPPASSKFCSSSAKASATRRSRSGSSSRSAQSRSTSPQSCASSALTAVPRPSRTPGDSAFSATRRRKEEFGLDRQTAGRVLAAD